MDLPAEVADAPQLNATMWTRSGFLGANAVTLQPGYAPDYISVDGPHAPRRLSTDEIETADRTDPSALPTLLLKSRTGVQVSLTRRAAPMPFAMRNVECDELFFIQSGEARFETEFGVIDAAEDDFVFLPRSVAYRVVPLSSVFSAILLENPEPLAFDTPAPFGMINQSMDVRRPAFDRSKSGGTPKDGAGYLLLLKSRDGITRFLKPGDPLETAAHVGGETPVWALSLRAIQPISYGGLGGPPAHFLASAQKSTLVFSLSSRASTMRPPVHHNADYDEIIFYARGPGAWGAVNEPGTIVIVPKGVTHHGPSENVPEGYFAWLVETGATMRFTPDILPQAKPMETGMYGIHPSAAGG
jgi:homogentisate 1,2-dioxygenase